jgi:hypothetical protein
MNSNSPPLDPSPEEQALAINAEQLSRHFGDWSKIWSQFRKQHGIWWGERVGETPAILGVVYKNGDGWWSEWLWE